MRGSLRNPVRTLLIVFRDESLRQGNQDARNQQSRKNDSGAARSRLRGEQYGHHVRI